MQTHPVSWELASRIEACEVQAWVDMYGAAPAPFQQQYQLELVEVGGVWLTRCKPIPFVHFNCVMNLGMERPASERDLDAALACYEEQGIRDFAVFHIPHSQPAALTDWLKARNLHEKGGWDRVYRGPQAAPPSSTLSPDVERVTASNAVQWAHFIDSVYGLPNTPWLLALVDRPGWYHYTLRRDGTVTMVRSMYVRDDWAWLGIDAPVPGLMGPCYDLDALVCRTIVADGLKMGVCHFVADIEAPSSEMSTPAYAHFADLGFQRPYFRSHYGLVQATGGEESRSNRD